MEMPSPIDKAGVQQLLDMVQYLSKFLPNLADLTKPLSDLTQKEVEWTWGPPSSVSIQGSQSSCEQYSSATLLQPIRRSHHAVRCFATWIRSRIVAERTTRLVHVKSVNVSRNPVRTN